MNSTGMSGFQNSRLWRPWGREVQESLLTGKGAESRAEAGMSRHFCRRATRLLHPGKGCPGTSVGGLCVSYTRGRVVFTSITCCHPTLVHLYKTTDVCLSASASLVHSAEGLTTLCLNHQCCSRTSPQVPASLYSSSLWSCAATSQAHLLPS